MTMPVASAKPSNARVLTPQNVTRAIANGPTARLGKMTHLRFRAFIVLLAGLAGLGVLASCGSVEVSVSRETSATTSAAEAPTATQAASAPAPTSGGAGTGTAAEPTATAAAVAQETRTEILQLDGALLDGQQFDFASTAGNDVLLWFWAPW